MSNEENEKFFKELDMLADIVAYDHISGFWVYRLNPAKVSAYGLDKAVEFLGNGLKSPPPPRTLHLLKKIAAEPIHIFIELDGGVLIIYPQKNSMIVPLINDGFITYDIHLKAYVAKAKDLYTILKHAEELGLKVRLGFNINYRASFKTSLATSLDSCLENAYNLWKEAGYRGVIVHPVPERRRLVALKAIHELGVKTAILVPSVDHLRNWYSDLVKVLKIPETFVGIYGAGVRKLGEVTVMTYDMAANVLPRFSSFFGFIVADECEIAVTETYREVLEGATAPYRLGLTSRRYADNNLHELYPELIGAVVFSVNLAELFDRGCVPRYRILRVYARLSNGEYEEWRRLMKSYAEFCRSALPRVEEPRRRLRAVLELAARDAGAREAIRARLKAREIVLAFEKKIRVVAKLLNIFSDDSIVVFSKYEDFVRELSRKLIVPAILPEIADDERRVYMNMFNRGVIRILATSVLLDEYVEAPQPNLAIVVSGVSSDKKYIDRVVRTLMPKKREALLIEVLTAKPHAVKNSFTNLEKPQGGAAI